MANDLPTHCKNGHQFTSENTKFREGWGRECIACRRERQREYMRRRRSRGE